MMLFIGVKTRSISAYTSTLNAHSSLKDQVRSDSIQVRFSRLQPTSAIRLEIYSSASSQVFVCVFTRNPFVSKITVLNLIFGQITLNNPDKTLVDTVFSSFCPVLRRKFNFNTTIYTNFKNEQNISLFALNKKSLFHVTIHTVMTTA